MYEELKQKFAACLAAPRAISSPPPAARSWAATTPTTSWAGCWPAPSAWTRWPPSPPNGERVIRIQSEGYPLCAVSLDELEIRPEDFGSTLSLIRGVAAGIAERGFSVTGFDAYVRSRVLPGSGLSSSAAFEVLLGTDHQQSGRLRSQRH